MAYLYKLKLQMQVYLTYRFEVFASILTRFLLIIANVFLWNCVYTDQTSIAGVNREQMITYSVLSACMSVFYQCGVQSAMNQDVRKGGIAIAMMRPFHLLPAYFADDLGAILVRTMCVSAPMLGIGFLFLGVQLPVTFQAACLVVASSLLGLLIMWFLSALVGMFAFVTLELGNMGVVKDSLVAILSGSMIPVWFFPEGFQRVLMRTPFPYTYQTPLGLYIGQISVAEGVGQIGIQALWAGLLSVLVILVWRRIQEKVMVQGG